MRLLKVAFAFGGELALNVSAISLYVEPNEGGANVEPMYLGGAKDLRTSAEVAEENGKIFLKIDLDADAVSVSETDEVANPSIEVEGG